MTPLPHPARWSATELAAALGQPHPPTPEQAAVIEAPLRPLLVVAGAGSGKTETMAARVVWLVANGYVDPDEVLGLTFTRKAASELSERLTARLDRLQQAGVWTPRDPDSALVGMAPTVSTYHAYAGRLVRDHGVRLGVEADSRLLGEAAAWQLAHEAVLAYDGPMDEVTKADSTITAAVLDLAGELAEHLVTLADVQAHLEEVIDALERVPRGEPSSRRTYPAKAREVTQALRERHAILPIVARYAEVKRRRDAMDFADHIALAARLALEFPEIGRGERGRFRAVLLDEFQDTSEAQLRLLQALFVEPGEVVNVTAVGDPHQSIYGWRGASATTLDRFVASFRDPDPAQVLPLSTSWRNDRAVLAAANLLAGPLRQASPVPVRELAARPDAGAGGVLVARLDTLEEEAAYLADWLAAARRPGAGLPLSAAVLCRKRSQFEPVIAALEERGLPVEVVGLGGLLLTPEVADLVALLHVVADPTRGDQLMRILTGPSCRLGVADLDALAAWSRILGRVGARTPEPRAQADRSRVDLAPDSAERSTLAEALDRLPPTGWTGPAGESLSEVGRARLSGLARVLQRLRGSIGISLPDLVTRAEQELGLDIEVAARAEYSPAAARAHLDAFVEVAASFASGADRPTLGGFLAWLDAALAEERGLELGWIERRDDAITVMTVHASKGLEWDLVAIPGLVESTFPVHSGNRSTPHALGWTHAEPTDKGWLGGLGALPHDLRGDRAGRPRFGWDTAATWDDLADELGRYLHSSADYALREERRLAYVAVTRARTAALLTAHIWGSASTPRLTSRFLLEVADGLPGVRRGPWRDLPATDPVPTSPRTAERMSLTWPRPLTSARRDQTIQAAASVHEAGAQSMIVEQPGSEVLDALLAERARAGLQGPTEVDLPAHLSTSALVALARDPQAFAESVRRPMPQPPAAAARLGTAFHAWVEGHYGQAAILDLDDLPGSADDDEGAEPLALLQEHFLASEWASRTPSEIETAVETVIDGVALRGRIDAVFAEEPDPARPLLRWSIIDWKTGRPPRGEDARLRSVQLAAYRLAWCRLRGVPPESVRAGFYYASTGETVFPELLEEAGLVALLPGQASALVSVPSGPSTAASSGSSTSSSSSSSSSTRSAGGGVGRGRVGTGCSES